MRRVVVWNGTVDRTEGEDSMECNGKRNGSQSRMDLRQRSNRGIVEWNENRYGRQK